MGDQELGFHTPPSVASDRSIDTRLPGRGPQIPFVIKKGDLTTAQHRITETIAQQHRTRSHLMLSVALHSLVALLDETGHHDLALEIWADLRDRTGWIDPTQRPTTRSTRYRSPTGVETRRTIGAVSWPMIWRSDRREKRPFGCPEFRRRS